MPISPLAPATFPHLPPVPGIRLAAANCGIKYKDRPDLLLMECAEGTTAAGVLTNSLTASAPVLACRKALKSGGARVLVVNSGNSNAFTGKTGEESVSRVRDAACTLLGSGPQGFYMASTGVIGEKLPDHLITAALPGLKDQLDGNGWDMAARAIMTTDTYPKLITKRAEIGGVAVTLNGIAKGSGMIAPDMATMLAFLATDAALPANVLQELLTDANARSFNCITVDGDTSTSDTALLFATGQAKHQPVATAIDPLLSSFRAALKEAMLELALLVVKDGEGATKLITVTVSGAEHDAAAKKIALTVANSPLVKTAIAGEDANWGRIVAAVGRAGEKASRDNLRIEIGGVCVARDGEADPDYKEEQITPHLKGRKIEINVDVGVGHGRAVVWTCDLTHGYIDINGSYRS